MMGISKSASNFKEGEDSFRLLARSWRQFFESVGKFKLIIFKKENNQRRESYKLIAAFK